MVATAPERCRKIQRMQVAMTIEICSYLSKNSVRTSIRTGRVSTSEILHGHPQRVFETLRMPITTFLDLGYRIRSTRGISIKEQLMMFP